MWVARAAVALAAVAGLLATAAPVVVHAEGPAVDAKIELVWPHYRNGVSDPAGPLVNVEVYLFERGTLNPVGCAFPNAVRLRWALNEEFGQHPWGPPYQRWGQLLPTGTAVPGYELPAEAVGQRRTRTANGVAFPYWVFNDVPVVNGIASAVPENRSTYFVVDVDGAAVRTGVWAHSHYPRTLLPTQLAAAALAPGQPAEADAMIQVVYPHDASGQLVPVDRAPLVNVAVDLFQHPVPFAFLGGPVPTAIGPAFDRPVWLLRALNTGYLERVKPADQVVAMQGSVAWPRYVFDDIDVSAAQDPLNRYYFAVQVDGVPTHTTIWAHGADTRTSFPQRDVPARSGAGC